MKVGMKVKTVGTISFTEFDFPDLPAGSVGIVDDVWGDGRIDVQFCDCDCDGPVTVMDFEVAAIA